LLRRAGASGAATCSTRFARLALRKGILNNRRPAVPTSRIRLVGPTPEMWRESLYSLFTDGRCPQPFAVGHTDRGGPDDFIYLARWLARSRLLSAMPTNPRVLLSTYRGSPFKGFSRNAQGVETPSAEKPLKGLE